MPVTRIAEFDLWRPGYANAVVNVRVVGTGALASIFLNETLTTPAANPQTLLSLEQNDLLYGKFTAPLYTSASYYLDINSTDVTGVMRPPLTTLADIDGSDLDVLPTGGTAAHDLADVLARVVNVADYGDFLPTSNASASSSTNNATLTAAISAVSSGGLVIVPAGTYAVTTLAIPARVVLVGQGKDVTILQSQSAAAVGTLNGDGAGFRDLTLDGVSLQASSVGVYAANKTGVVLDRVRVARFNVGVYCRGAHACRWDLDIDGCTTNAQLYGDTASSGSTFTDNYWTGRCVNSVTLGLDLEWITTSVLNNRFVVGFENNAGTAVKIRGARYTDFAGSWWSGTVVRDLDVDDFAGGSFAAGNTVAGLWFRDFDINGVAMLLKGSLLDVCFERGSIEGCAITLTTPGHAVIARDVNESSTVTLAGDGTKWLRWKTGDHGASSGLTTNNAATKAWSIALAPGQRVVLVARVIANAKTSDESGEYYIAVSASRPPSQLAYDTQTANFAPGLILTGATSGAFGLIVADADSGAFGTLKLRNITGIFLDNEIITDTATGSAMANGSQADQNATLLGSVTSLRAAREDDAAWDATFVANGPEIELRVTGANAKTIEWLVDVDVTKT